MSYNRRMFLRDLGLVVWLPVLPSLMPSQARAAVSGARNKFIGVFTPSGALMPGAVNGNWTFESALAPLQSAGHRANVAILRGLTARSLTDPHWNNTSNFLSGHEIQIPSRAVVKCGKTFDQLVADKHASPLRSLHVGWKDMNRDFSSDHPTYSDRYLTTLSWRSEDRPLSNSYNPRELFDGVFTSSEKGRQRLIAMNAKKRSVLDLVVSDLQSIKNKAGSEDRVRLEHYQESLRDLETSLSQPPPVCSAPVTRPEAVLAYRTHFESMQKIITTAMQCDLISSATIMYDDGVGDVFLAHDGAINDHHHYAHHGNAEDKKNRLNTINRIHSEMFAHLLGEMKAKNLMDKTLVAWSSNMSDGDAHLLTNMPFVIAGAGSDLRLGGEIGSATGNTPRANVFVEMAPLLGLELTSFGGGVSASNSTRIGIKS